MVSNVNCFMWNRIWKYYICLCESQQLTNLLHKKIYCWDCALTSSSLNLFLLLSDI